MRKTAHQIIDETVEFYSNNPRALEMDSCRYQTDEGFQCAHSRCLTNEARTKILSEGRNGTSADYIIDELGDECHKEEYRGHSWEFWLNIQIIHDTSSFWEDRTFTERGRLYVEALKEKYINV